MFAKWNKSVKFIVSIPWAFLIVLQVPAGGNQFRVLLYLWFVFWRNNFTSCEVSFEDINEFFSIRYDILNQVLHELELLKIINVARHVGKTPIVTIQSNKYFINPNKKEIEGEFIDSIPWPWLQKLQSPIGGSTFRVALYIWFLRGVKKSDKNLIVSLKGLSRYFPIDRRAFRKALTELESLDLISVQKLGNKSPLIDINCSEYYKLTAERKFYNKLRGGQ